VTGSGHGLGALGVAAAPDGTVFVSDSGDLVASCSRPQRPGAPAAVRPREPRPGNRFFPGNVTGPGIPPGTVGGVPGRSDAAAYAPNWKTVILVDAALGWVAIIVGLALASVPGLVVAFAGAAYLMAVWRRLRRWRRLRLARGLPV